MNTFHFSNKDLYAIIVEPDTIDENQKLHLKKCRNCQKRLKNVEEFLQAYQKQGEHTEINWIREKGKILSAVSYYHTPFEVWFFPESIREAELPQNIALLTEWEGEDFRQFINFFSPIEEERNEKNDSITNSLRINRFDQSVSA